MDRRTFLVASTVGLVGLPLGQKVGAVPAKLMEPRRRPARSAILFFLCGGASHIDMWDLKPEAPREYRGPFQPIKTTAPGVEISEHLPRTARMAHHLAIVRSVTDFGRATGDHHAGYYYQLTGNLPDATFRLQGNDRTPQPDDLPFMGSVVGSRRPPHPKLPTVITLPQKPSPPPYIRPGQFAGRLGLEHDPFYLYGKAEQPLQFSAPSLTLQTGLDTRRLAERRSLLQAVNQARRNLDHHLPAQNYTRQQQKAFELLASGATANAFDLAVEPAALRARYGQTINGMSLLLARRLVEAAVPFITVFWVGDSASAEKFNCASGGGWDTHGNNFDCLRQTLLPEFDQAFSALIEDLSQRGLLADTLVMVTSEMGRKPQIGDPRSGGARGAGRDHWTACQSVVLAGGGIRGGQTFGRTDARAEYPADHPVGPEHIAHTVYHAMGIDDLAAVDAAGRRFNILELGRPLTEIFS